MERKPHASLGIQCNRDLEDSQHCIINQRTFKSARDSRQQLGDKNYLDCELVEKCASQEDYKVPDFEPDFSDDCQSDRSSVSDDCQSDRSSVNEK